MSGPTEFPHASRPCAECPFRLDVPVGKFTPQRYEALRDTVGMAGAEARFNAPVFACHISVEGKDRACAGWLATVGIEHLGIRLMVATGRLPADTLTPKPGWPDLYPDYDSMAEANDL